SCSGVRGRRDRRGAGGGRAAGGIRPPAFSAAAVEWPGDRRGRTMTHKARRGSWTLIELVVVMVILVALAAWLLPKYLGTGKNATAQNTIQAPIQRDQGPRSAPRLVC